MQVVAYRKCDNMTNILLYDLFDEYLESCNAQSNTKYCMKNFINNILKKYFRNIDINNVTHKHIQNFINFEKAQLLQEITIYNYFKTIKSIFNFAVKCKYIQSNPCQNVRIKRVIFKQRALDYSRSYIKQLLKAFKKTKKLKMYMCVFLAIHTRNAKR